VAAWIDEQVAQPWESPAQARAAAIFAEHGPLIALLLITTSLVHAYAAPVGAGTLRMTYRMNHDVRRRVGETAQFVLAVMDPRGFSPDGMALPTILKVRLMHAAIRRLIQDWVHDKYGMPFGEFVFEQHLAQDRDEIPISQEDLLGTLMTFSEVVLQGLQRMGAPQP
jgi:hypothetical protein